MQEYCRGVELAKKSGGSPLAVIANQQYLASIFLQAATGRISFPALLVELLTP
jgi:hypothetical protein